MTLESILCWWNLLFAVPFAIAVLYLILYAASGLTFGEAGDADQDFDADPHGDLDADHDAELNDAHHDLGHDAGGDAEGDADSDTDSDTQDASPTEPGSIRLALAWLGVGRVPLSILLMVLLITWGATGFLVNQLAKTAFASDWQVILLSAPIAGLFALSTTHLVVRSIARWLPLDETTARRRHDLLGLTGTATLPIDARFGMVSVRDDRGELYQVACRLTGGHPPIAKEGKAVLVAFNARERLYHVIPPDAVGPT